jgi:hypothetical protein
MANYVAAIKTCQSFHELAAALRIQVGPARAYIRKRWDDLPADSRPQWLADAIVPASKQEAGKMGGKTRPHKMIARSKPLQGAAQQIAVLNAKPPTSKIWLKPLPAGLVIEGAEKWDFATAERLRKEKESACQPAP